MRTLPVLIVSIVLGVAIGSAAAYWAVGPSQSVGSIAALRGGPSGSSAVAGTVFPEFKIDATSYNFGAMERGTTREHTFVVTNVGTGPLTVNVGQPSCKCTVGKAPSHPIPPGASDEIELRWTAKVDAGDFRQTAPLFTNDPRATRVELTIEGRVTEVSGIQPRQWMFDKLHAGDERTESVYVMSYYQDELELKTAKLEDEASADLFEITITEVPRSELPDSKALSGVRVDVTTKGVLPLGGIYHWVVLETNLPDAEEIKVPIIGSVVGDIAIRGPAAWSESLNSVVLGEVASEVGAEVKLFLSVKGEHSEGIKFEVTEVDPPQLEVDLGEPRTMREGVVRVPLTVRVPAGLTPVIRNGTGQGDAGHVRLKSNHPLSPEISFEVRYIVRRGEQ